MEKVLVCSAKGGSGKTTVTVSLAATLAEKYKVGIIDGDMSTPDCHRLMNCCDIDIIYDSENKLKIIPAECRVNGFKNTVKLLSLGLVAPDAPFIWNENYMSGAIDQIINNALWGDIDVILIDSPPTLHIDFQKFAKVATRAVLVLLPDDLSLLGAMRCLEALSIIGTPVVGYIENMSYLQCKCGEVHRIFRKSIERDLGIPKIGELPIQNEKVFRIPFAEEILTRKPVTLKKKSIRKRLLKLLLEFVGVIDNVVCKETDKADS